jgi:tetratricopeptide (TPR) repeat protein
MIHIVSIIFLVAGCLLIAAGAAAIVYVFVRKLPTVALINLQALPVDKAAKKKEEIIADRIIRKLAAKSVPFKKASSTVWIWLRERFRRLAHKAFELERKSEHLARKRWDALTAATRLHALMHEGDKLAKEDKFVEAEKQYIEALSIEQKNPKLYEKLGRLYLRNKQYEQARDTFRFASRLSPNDASVVASLGEVAMAREEYSDAITYFQHAVSLRPRSPRYLDFLLEACIVGGDKACARETFNLFASVNPDNAKLPDIDRRIKEMA